MWKKRKKMRFFSFFSCVFQIFVVPLRPILRKGKNLTDMELVWITNSKYLGEYRLELTFSNGKAKIFDILDYRFPMSALR